MNYSADTEIPHSDLKRVLEARKGWELMHVLPLVVPGSQALPMVSLIWREEGGDTVSDQYGISTSDPKKLRTWMENTRQRVP